MKKKLFSVLMILALLAAMVVPTLAAMEDTGFADVDAGAWYAGAVEYAKDNGLMGGTSSDSFEPDGAMTRSMLATVLYHAAGSPSVTEAPAFSDTAAGSWYSGAVSWAVKNNIVSGYGNGLFGTDDPATREQIASILWKYDGSPAAASGTDFADEAAISAYASTAVDWARAEGIVNGKENNRFDPAGNATRAEVASILMNYLQNRASGSTPAPEPTPEPTPESGDTPKVLVAYFSCTNTTKSLAEYAADALKADLYEIVPETPYTSADLNYNDSSSRATIEMNDAASRPAISGSVENMEQYDIVFLGYPIWWGLAPKITSSFLESYDFAGKTIVPFCTSGSSGIGSSAVSLHALTDGAEWLSGQRFGSGTARASMVEWINGLNLNITAE